MTEQETSQQKPNTEEKTPPGQQASPPAQKKEGGKLQQMLDSLPGVKKVLIVTHDNPDPDALSSAAALKYLLKKVKKVRCKIVYGGAIVRPENRAMTKILKIPLQHIQKVKPSSYKAIAMVDTQPQFGNNSLSKKTPPTIVIDHHPPKRGSETAPYSDLRKEYGATATIMTEYLLESGLPIPSRLATALFYGIASETQDLGREATPSDTDAYLTLFPKSNKRSLSLIRNARVPRSHFQHLEQGLRNSFTYKNVIGSRLGDVNGQDIVALMADLLLRLERITWSIVLGRYEGRLFVSIRTLNTRARCGSLLRRILGKSGSAGGHDMIAGGFVPIEGMSDEEISELEERLIRKFMSRVGHKDIQNFEWLVAPAKMVPKSDIPKNITQEKPASTDGPAGNSS